MSHLISWPVFIDPNTLHERLSNQVNAQSSGTVAASLLIWDLTSKEQYQHRHLPQAQFVPFASMRTGTAPIVGLLPNKDQLTHLFQSLGLQEQVQVVLYDDDGGGKAGRMAWTLDVIGHHHYSIIDGGLAAWEAQGLPITSEIPTIPSSDLKVSYLCDTLVVTKDWLLAQLDNPQLCIWDARSAQEFSGELARAAKPGHIPGAINYDWLHAMQLHPYRHLRPLEAIREELADLGITGDKTIVTHCQTHHRSGFTYVLGKALGFKDIRAYPGSFAEWGNAEDTPVEQAS